MHQPWPNRDNVIESRLTRRDTSVRKQAEWQDRESNRPFRQTVDCMKDDAIVVLDLDGNVVSWNHSAQELMGYLANEIIGRHVSSFYPANDVEQGQPACDLQVALAKGQLEDEGWRIRKDGSRFLANVFITTIRDGQGSPIAFSKVIRDLTRQKETEKQLRRADRLASAGTLAVGIAHEINNPLSAAWTAAEMALQLKDDANSELFAEALHTVVDSVKRCNQIVQNVLRFSRNGTSTRSPHDINEIIQHVCDMSRCYAEQNGVRIVVELAEGLSEPMINAIEIEQVLVNLISNAIEASDGSEAIIVSSLAAGDTVCFTVKDNGRGIPDDEQAKIFEPFYTNRSDERGIGLGLSIAHRIIQDHDGSIEITSGIGKGTSMRVELPTAAASSIS